MAMQIGDMHAASGLSKAIYDRVREVMEPVPGISGDDVETLRDSWRKLAYAVARGVVEHLQANMEIKEVQTRGDVSVSVNGNTQAAQPGPHAHGVGLSGVQNGVVFDQVAGSGRVE